MPHNKDLATIRVVVKMTKEEVKRLKEFCDRDVRTVGSWFRLQVQKAWRSRKPPKKQSFHCFYQRNADDGLVRNINVWARLTEEERDQLEVLCGDENVSISIWYRRRLPQDASDKMFAAEQRRVLKERSR